MKYRDGFVSNSSSSSFLVIKGNADPNISLEKDFIIGKLGKCKFGWEPRRYSDINDKINFAYLQALYNETWMDMLYDVLKKRGAKNISCALSSDYNAKKHERWAYIDHQSSAGEGQNTEIFDNVDILEQFIFSYDSFIMGDNDNY
jgi:hypothetical protein